MQKIRIFSVVNEYKKKYRSISGTIITVEGLIGVGKSTIGKKLECFLNNIGLNCKFFPEFICKPILNQFISNMNKYAYSFQMNMLLQRINIYNNAYEFSCKSGGISIVDRSLTGDYTFAEMMFEKGNISEEEFRVYKEVLVSLKKEEPDIILYLQCLPEIAYKRMKSRGIESEISGYSIEYFRELNEKYTNNIKKLNHPVLTIDWNEDKDLNDEDIIKVLDIIKNYLFY